MRRKVLFFILLLSFFLVVAGCKVEQPYIKAVYITPATIGLDQTAKITVDVKGGGQEYYVEYRATYGYFSVQGATETVYYPTAVGVDTITIRLLGLSGEIFDSETIEVVVK